MANKKDGKSRFIAKAGARIEAVAKATYVRKKTVTEVIPSDVTRAKVGRWLDLISPITEWAGLKGDALRHQRQQLRVQQEAALDRLAASVREKMADKTVTQPLPPKFIVPALEAASLESETSPLIEWWASLLVSGATGGSLRPYLVDLMKRLGAEEAAFLESLWIPASSQMLRKVAGGKTVRSRDTLGILTWLSFVQMIKSGLHRQSDLSFEQWTEDTDRVIERAASKFVVSNEEKGAPVRLTIPLYSGGISWSSSPILEKSREALDVSRALNIVDFVDKSETIRDKYERSQQYEIRILEFTDLGVEFMDACRPNSSTT